MRAWENLNHILETKKIDKEIFFAEYDRSQLLSLKRADKVIPMLKNIARELDVDVYFILKYNGPLEGLIHFPCFYERETSVKSRDVVQIDDNKFLNNYKKIVSADIIADTIADVFFEGRHAMEISIKEYNERIRNLNVHNVVECGKSLMYTIKTDITIPIKVYYVMHSKKMSFKIELKCILKDIKNGHTKSLFNISHSNGDKIGETTSIKLDKVFDFYFYEYERIKRDIKKYSRKQLFVEGKEPEFIEELYIPEKNKKGKIIQGKDAYISTASFENIKEAYYEQKSSELYD